MGEGLTLEEYGEQLYSAKACITCHSLDGSIKEGPSFLGRFGDEALLDDGSPVAVDENYLRESILNPKAKIVNGYQPVMPTLQGILKDRQIDALIVMRLDRPTPPAIKLTVLSLIGLVVLQAGSGIFLQVSSLPPLTDPFHLWMAGLSIGLQLVLFTLLGRPPGESLRWHGNYARVMRDVAVVMVLLGLMAYFVIARAAKSRARLPQEIEITKVLS